MLQMNREVMLKENAKLRDLNVKMFDQCQFHYN
jgi:hypothetical protein